MREVKRIGEKDNPHQPSAATEAIELPKSSGIEILQGQESLKEKHDQEQQQKKKLRNERAKKWYAEHKEYVKLQHKAAYNAKKAATATPKSDKSDNNGLNVAEDKPVVNP